MMFTDPYPWLAVAPVVGLVGNVISHIGLSQWTTGRRVATCLAAGFLVGLLLCTGITLGALACLPLTFMDAVSLLALNTATGIGLGLGYFAFTNLNIASLRIRVLGELLARPEGITQTELLAFYNADELVQRRIARLTTGKQLQERDGRFYARTSIFLLLGHFLKGLKWFVLGRSPGRGSPQLAKPGFTRDQA
jgi:hypothetical protein